MGFSADEATWVTIAYLSAELLSIPLAGYFSRAFSRRWYLSISAVVFVLASLACTLAWDLPSFLVCRTVQGFVAGVFLVTALTVVLTQMPRSEQHIGLVMIGIISSLPTPIAQLVAGAFVDHYSWHYFYYLNIPLGLLLTLFCIWELSIPNPLVDLHLLEQRNFGLINIVNFSVGLILADLSWG